MNYSWEMMIHLMGKSIKKEEIFFRQAKEYSPYYEQAFQNINQGDVEDRTIEMNGFFRFDEIFAELLNPNQKEDMQFREYLFDIIMHDLIEIDLLRGLSKREFYIRKIIQDILNGHYGERTKDQLGKLPGSLQHILCNHILTQFQIGSSVLLFSEAVRILFPESIVYKNNLDKKELLVYLGERRNETTKRKMDLITSMFLPIGHKVRIFYEHHFGILGVAETLQLGNIEIF